MAEWSVLCLQGHVSFPLLLNLSPFAGGTFTTGQGPGPSAMNVQRYDTSSLHFYRQLNAHTPINVLPTGGNSSSQAPKDQVTNGGGYSFNEVCYLLWTLFLLDLSVSRIIAFLHTIFYLSDQFIYPLDLFREMLIWLWVLRRHQGWSYIDYQLSLSTMVYAEVGIMQLTGEWHQILMLIIK